MLEVVAGLIFDAQGRVLIARRPKHKAHGGLWEFPGGKKEREENLEAALIRELHEELGLAVRAAQYWFPVTHAYPNLSVRLHFFRVTATEGQAHGREGQELRWVRRWELNDYQFPEANLSVVRALGGHLPSPLYVIADLERMGTMERLAEALQDALAGGARFIQLRAKQLEGEDYGVFATNMLELIRRQKPTAKVLLNTDPEWVRKLDADGVHLSAARLSQLADYNNEQKHQWGLVGASCHDRQGLRQAYELSADFALLSPVFATASHPGTKPLALADFAYLIAETPLPVYGLGGITPENAAMVHAAGAAGVAVVGGVLQAGSPSQAVQAFTNFEKIRDGKTSRAEH